MDALAEDDIVAVASFNELAVDIEVALFRFDTLLEFGVVVLRLAPLLLGFGEFKFLFAVESVLFAVAKVGNGLAVGGKYEARCLAFRIQVAVHQLVPLQELVLRHHCGGAHHGRQCQ